MEAVDFRLMSQIGFFGELRSDNTTVQYDLNSRAVAFMERVDQFLMQSSNGVVKSAWENSYIGISKCNTLLHFIEDKEVEKKERYVAEAKFLRAYYYFHLVRHFGDVPLITKMVTSYDESFNLNKRVPKEQVYELILSDLNEAKGNLPPGYSGSDVGKGNGRCCTNLTCQSINVERPI